MTEPGWKRNNRNGPFDWWLTCRHHGYDYRTGCLGCLTASDLNAEFAVKLEAERIAAELRVGGEPEYQSWLRLLRGL